MKKSDVIRIVKKVSKKSNKSCKKGMDVFILLDRSGSMQTMWEEAIGSINAYVNTLAKDKAPDRITVATFDSHAFTSNQPKVTYTASTHTVTTWTNCCDRATNSFDILRDKVAIDEWNPITPCEVCPRGGTPLYDAFAQLVDLAECVNNERTAIVVVTDGEENSSRIHNSISAKEIVKRVEARKWQINFLGCNFDNSTQTSLLGVHNDYSIAYTTGCASGAMSYTASLASDYRDTGYTKGYSTSMRSAVGEDKVKK
jgi:hypothetical protein